MLAIIAAVLFAVGYVLDGAGDHTNTWLSPGALVLAGLALLALHLSGVTWTRRPPQ
jgi:hypothetical protein